MRPHLFALITAIIWSLSYVNLKYLTHSLDPTTIVGLRFDFFALVLIPLWIIRKPAIATFTPRQWALVITLGIIGGPLYHLLLTAGAAHHATNASLIGLIIATVPIYAALMAWAFLKEKPSLWQFAALIIGLAGVGLVITERSSGLWELSTLTGPILLLIAAIVGGANTVLMRGGRTITNPIDLIIVSGSCGVAIMLPLQWWGDPSAILDLTPRGWAAGAYLGIIAIGVAYVTWCTALRDLQATSVAMYLFVTNCLSALWAWLFQGDHIGWGFLGGSTLVLIGLILGATSKPPPPRVAGTAPVTTDPSDQSP
jgi:drug/metabolite transporter (DMT)-like permease